MNVKERIDALRAMELLARSVNVEDFLEDWFMNGVADGDINENTIDEELTDYVTDNEFFADIMNTFLILMRNASEDGGLYIDGVVSS